MEIDARIYQETNKSSNVVGLITDHQLYMFIDSKITDSGNWLKIQTESGLIGWVIW